MTDDVIRTCWQHPEVVWRHRETTQSGRPPRSGLELPQDHDQDVITTALEMTSKLTDSATDSRAMTTTTMSDKQFDNNKDNSK